MLVSSLFVISCGNEDKTGSSSDSGQSSDLSTSSDLGATYSGTWNFTGELDKETLKINTDGSCIMANVKAKTVTKNSDNNYTVVFITDVTDATGSFTTTMTLNITFDKANSGTVKVHTIVLENGTKNKVENNINENIVKNN